MKLKKLSNLTICIILCVALAACGSQNNQGNHSNQGSQTSGNTSSGETINVVLYDNLYSRGLEPLVPQFEEESGINVNLNILGQDVALKRMELDFVGKTGDLDVAYMSFIMMQKWVKAGWIEPLDAYANQDEALQLDDFAKAPIESLSLDGQLWALPSFSEVGLMAYRSDIFEEHGITSPPETWEELMEVAQTIHSDETASIALRAKRGQGLNMFIFPSMLWAFGGSYFEDYPNDMTPVIDREENIEALKFYTDLVQNYSPDGAGNYSFAEVIAAYQQGNAAMVVDGTSIISQFFDESKSPYADETKVALVPGGPGGRSPMIAVHGLAIAQASEKKDAAYEFIKWATSTEVQKTIALEQYYMDTTRNSIAEDPEIQAQFDLDGGNFMKLRIESLNMARADYRPLIPEWPEIGDIFGAQVNGAVNGGYSAEDALKEANKQITEVLKNAGYE